MIQKIKAIFRGYKLLIFNLTRDYIRLKILKGHREYIFVNGYLRKLDHLQKSLRNLKDSRGQGFKGNA